MNNAGKIVTFIIDNSWRRLLRVPIMLLLCSMGYAVLAATFSTAVSSATLAQRVVKLPQWPGVSQLIVYKDRIWFVNSEPFDDTNIADIHSYSVDTGQVRYERSLFSQDTGNPVVYKGLLHWPFEDPRRSAGTGEYAITDGTDWRWRSMQSGSVMHVHAMNVCNERLVAVTGSWTGQLHEQQPDGAWNLQYEVPAGDAPFSRLVSVQPYNDQCAVGAAISGESAVRLFSVQGAAAKSFSNWPTSNRVDVITHHQGAIFAFADTRNVRELLWFDGEKTERIELPEGSRPRALHSDGDNLWLATQEPVESHAGGSARGTLWQYTGAGAFTSLVRIESPPIALTSLHEQVFIGTYDSAGGELWVYGEANPRSLTSASVSSAANTANVAGPAELHVATDAPVNQQQVTALYNELSDLLKNSSSTQNFARGLRDSLSRHPRRYDVEFGAAIGLLLQDQYDLTPVRMFTERLVPTTDLVQWYLILALAINGHGHIDPAFIVSEKPVVDHNSGKIFHPSVAAIVASGWLNQRDSNTIDALMQRLNRQADPVWVRADVIGALTALTGQRFAYDVDQWNQWWESQRQEPDRE